jgi:hypothetical protein
MPKRTALDARMKSIDAMTLYENICKRAKDTGANLLNEIEDNNVESTLEESFSF